MNGNGHHVHFALPPAGSEDEELIDLDEANVPLTNGVTNGNGHVNGAVNDADSSDGQSTTDSQTAAAAQELFDNWDGV